MLLNNSMNLNPEWFRKIIIRYFHIFYCNMYLVFPNLLEQFKWNWKLPVSSLCLESLFISSMLQTLSWWEWRVGQARSALQHSLRDFTFQHATIWERDTRRKRDTRREKWGYFGFWWLSSWLEIPNIPRTCWGQHKKVSNILETARSLLRLLVLPAKQWLS